MSVAFVFLGSVCFDLFYAQNQEEILENNQKYQSDIEELISLYAQTIPTIFDYSGEIKKFSSDIAKIDALKKEQSEANEHTSVLEEVRKGLSLAGKIPREPFSAVCFHLLYSKRGNVFFI